MDLIEEVCSWLLWFRDYYRHKSDEDVEREIVSLAAFLIARITTAHDSVVRDVASIKKALMRVEQLLKVNGFMEGEDTLLKQKEGLLVPPH